MAKSKFLISSYNVFFVGRGGGGLGGFRLFGKEGLSYKNEIVTEENNKAI